MLEIEWRHDINVRCPTPDIGLPNMCMTCKRIFSHDALRAWSICCVVQRAYEARSNEGWHEVEVKDEYFELFWQLFICCLKWCCGNLESHRRIGDRSSMHIYTWYHGMYCPTQLTFKSENNAIMVLRSYTDIDVWHSLIQMCPNLPIRMDLEFKVNGILCALDEIHKLPHYVHASDLLQTYFTTSPQCCKELRPCTPWASELDSMCEIVPFLSVLECILNWNSSPCSGLVNLYQSIIDCDNIISSAALHKTIDWIWSASWIEIQVHVADWSISTSLSSIVTISLAQQRFTIRLTENENSQ